MNSFQKHDAIFGADSRDHTSLKAQETVICECLSEVQISDDIASCQKCGRTLYSTRSLKEKQKKLCEQIQALKVEEAHIMVELHLRSRRKPSRQYLLKEDFYAGVKGVPRGEKVKRENKPFELSTAEIAILKGSK